MCHSEHVLLALHAAICIFVDGLSAVSPQRPLAFSVCALAADLERVPLLTGQVEDACTL